MSTFTGPSHRSYGPLSRCEVMIDGELYAVTRGDLHPVYGRKYHLRLESGAVDSYTYIPESADSEKMMEAAKRRLLGKGGQ